MGALTRGHIRRFAIVFLYACATLQAVRYYSIRTFFYLRMSAYLNGHERLPFQERILPIAFLRWMYSSTWVVRHFHQNGAFTPSRGPFYVLSLISLIVAGIFAQKLYDAVSSRRTLRGLVYPLFLFTVLFTYAIHLEADFSYPYDLPSLAFFTAGLYYIYTRRFWPLLLTIMIGSFNRETTLFLIGIYILDWATAKPNELGHAEGEKRFNLSLVPWMRAGGLLAMWLAIHFGLKHAFHGNDTSEDFLRWGYNIDELTPRFLPALLNVCGYTLPAVVLFRRRLQPTRFANYLYILPLWLAIMFCSGVLVETRIYGELCSYSAISLVLILEAYAEVPEPREQPRRPARRSRVEEMTTT